MAQKTSSFAPASAWLRAGADYLGLVGALLLLVVVFGLATEHFLSPDTFRTIANQIPAAMLLATGMTLVLITGEIDLSVGSVLGLCGAVTGVALVQWGWPVWAALVAALAIGAACGAFNGLVSVRWRLPSFIVTLGMLEMARGAAHALTQSQTQYIGPAIEGLAGGHLLGFSLPFWLALLIVVLAQAALSHSVFGRHMLAVGANEAAARLNGIDPRRIKASVFVLSGLLAGLAALVDTSRFQSANPNAGTGFELQAGSGLELAAIAACVIGGTSLMGGRGSAVRTFLGVLIIALLNTGLASVGAKDEMKRLVTGAVIVAAVILDHYRHRLARPART